MSELPRSRRHLAWDRIRITGRAIERTQDPGDVEVQARELVAAVSELEEWRYGPLYVGAVMLSHEQMQLLYSMARIAYASKAGTEEGQEGWVRMREARENYRRATVEQLEELLLALGEAWTRLGWE